jgi:prepilin-type N-terminal cleavage/methylation domain-containing protein
MCFNDKGFTLVEVLIASLILFSVLGISTLSYRGAVLAVERTTAAVLIADALPTIMTNVKNKLFSRQTEGTGRFLNDISYSWKSRVAKTAKNIISAHDEITGGMRYGAFTLVLNEVRLTITYEKGVTRKKVEYEYQELSWSR